MRGFIVGTVVTAHRLLRSLTRSCSKPNIDLRRRRLGGLVVLALIVGVVNGLIKPIVRLLSLPDPHGDAGPVRLRHQRRPAPRSSRWIADQLDVSASPSATSRRTSTADTIVGALIGSVVLSVVGTRSIAALSSPTEPDGPAAGDRRGRCGRRRGGFGTPVYVTDLAAIDAAVAGLAAAFPDPWIRQYSVKANDVAGGHRGGARAASGVGANVVSRGEWAAARAAGVAERRGSRSRGSARPTPTCGRPCARRGDGDAAALGRGRVGRRGWRRWPRSRVAAGSAAASRAVDVLLRLNPDVAPETLAGLAVGAGALASSA